MEQAARALGWSGRSEFRQKITKWFTGGPGSGQIVVRRVRKRMCDKIKSKVSNLVTVSITHDKEDEADEFGRKSMKRGYEHKVLDYNSENYNRYWNEQKR